MTVPQEVKDLDNKFPNYAELFEIPNFKSLGIKNSQFSELTNSIYFCGNSLGLMPKQTKIDLINELNAWSERGVESHFNHPTSTPWVDIDLPLLELMSPIIGAKQNEIAIMGSLTSNLNSLLIHFYKPIGNKTKILFEKGAFPSDYYAFLNLVKIFGGDELNLIQLEIKPGETYLKTEDIKLAIDKYKDELALICFPGIQYYTGQLFNIEEITKKAHDNNILIGWDLAHAVGNVPLKLHDWNVDFAAWCSYKYLNSGPGGIAGIYVNEKFTMENSSTNFKPRLAGWWGNNSQQRFKMLEKFEPINSALSYRQSNPSVIDVVCVKSSLKMFKEIGGIEKLRLKSIALTNFLQDLLINSKFYIDQSIEDSGSKIGYKILTPLNENERGCQLSVLFKPHFEDPQKNIMERVFNYLHDFAIIVDERRPDVIRFAPLPLYNTFEEIYYVTNRLFEILESITSESN